MSETCTHESWNCSGSWHVCSDCNQSLGTLQKPIRPHLAEDCGVCALGSPWVTKDSGKRQEYTSGMVRDLQDGKPRFDLLFVKDMPYDQQPLTRWAGLLERGAGKYGEENWTLAESEEELRRFRASAARHFAQWMTGELDEDHMAAVFFNMTAVAYMEWKLANENPAR